MIEQRTNTTLDTKQTRVVKKTVPTDSFFNFFDPPKAPDDGEEGDVDIEERLELDYQLGEDIKEKLIPRAIDWFTGEALQFEELEDELAEGGFEDEDDEEEDDLSEDRDEEDESDEEVSNSQVSKLYGRYSYTPNRTTAPSQSKRRPSANRASSFLHQLPDLIIDDPAHTQRPSPLPAPMSPQNLLQACLFCCSYHSLYGS